MSHTNYIRSISAMVPKYSRNSNEILRNERLYEGAYPSDADPADYVSVSSLKKAVRLG